MSAPRSLRSLLRETRLERGLTQEELARAAGITRVYIASVESGHITPSVPALRRILRVLDPPAEDLLAALKAEEPRGMGGRKSRKALAREAGQEGGETGEKPGTG